MSTLPPPEATAPGAGPPAGRPGDQPPRRDPDEQPAWPLWTALAGIGLALGLGLVVSSILIAIIASAAGYSFNHLPPGLNLAGDVLFDLGFVVAALCAAKMTGPVRALDFGFRRIPVGRAVAAVLAAGLSYYVLSYAYAALFDLHGNEKLPSELGAGKSTAALVGAAVFVCVIAPIAEEFFFRGFLFGVLRRMRIVVGGRNIGVWVAAVEVGLLFGLAHSGSAAPRYLIPLGFLGFVLCVVRWRTGSLYPCMALHSLNNLSLIHI